MRVIQDPREMQRVSDSLRKAGKTIGFVPTMGYFHDGHLQLMREAKIKNDIAVVSLYVNPTQFGPTEDFTRYPRDLNRDSTLALGAGVDFLFIPSDDNMYPPGYSTYVTVKNLTNKLCGLRRPGHFEGVATIVLKLFNAVRPDQAFFGQKDYQQLLVVKRLVQDLHLTLEIVTVETMREADGLAMSSRNSYLLATQREVAATLYRALKVGQSAIEQGVQAAAELRTRMLAVIEAEPQFTLDYLEVCDPESLDSIAEVTGKTLIAVAAKLGTVRLIDNILVDPPKISAV